MTAERGTAVSPRISIEGRTRRLNPACVKKYVGVVDFAAFARRSGEQDRFLVVIAIRRKHEQFSIFFYPDDWRAGRGGALARPHRRGCECGGKTRDQRGRGFREA